MHDAAAMPAHRARAARLRRKAALFALATNAPERLGDISALRFGPGGLCRHASGVWSLKVVQGKTRGVKRNPALWAEVGAMLDAYILAGRDPETVQDVYEGLQGSCFMSLAPVPAHEAMPSALFREEFAISAHMIRTLVVDFLKWHGEEGTAGVCQALLGHRDPEMHEEYRTDFRDQAALGRYHAVIGAIRKPERPQRAA
jgi:integrase